MKGLRHQCDVMEPPKSWGTVGERIGKSKVYGPYRDVPCSVDDVTGTENQIANQTTGTKTFRVKTQSGHPKFPITNQHWIRWQGRILNIADAKDIDQNGLKYDLLCGEVLDQKK